MKIQNMEMKYSFSNADVFVRVIDVTKYRKTSPVHCQLSDPKLRPSAKILNKSNVSRCTYY